MVSAYDRRVLIREMAVAALLLLCALVPLAIDAHIVVLVPAVAILLVASYRLATLMIDWQTTFFWDEERFEVRGIRAFSSRWSDISECKIRYFGSTKQVSVHGYQLTLRSGQNAIRLHGAITQFDALVRMVRTKSEAHDWALDHYSADNLVTALQTVSSRDNSAPHA